MHNAYLECIQAMMVLSQLNRLETLRMGVFGPNLKVTEPWRGFSMDLSSSPLSMARFTNPNERDTDLAFFLIQHHGFLMEGA